MPSEKFVIFSDGISICMVTLCLGKKGKANRISAYYKHHPADGYDGPQGTRDIYSYVTNGTASRTKIVLDDNRSTEQRFADRFGNIPSNFAARAQEAHNKMFDHNPNLNRWGNAMEFINGVAAGALNPFQSAGEALGIGDMLYGAGYVADKATMYGLAPLSPDGKLSAIGGLGSLGGVQQRIGSAVSDWTAENPNAAETVEAAFNAAAAAKAAQMAKTGTGKATVSEDFGDAYRTSNGTANAATQAKLKAQLVGQEISRGHAFEKHVVQKQEYTDLGITTRQQFAKHIENVVANPTSVKSLSNGRSAYWDSSTGTVVIRNPKAPDGGTAFRPAKGRQYFDTLR